MRQIADDNDSLELCSETGARRLAARIRDYWIARGYRGITTGIVEHKTPKQKRRGLDAPIFGVISNIGQSGYPPR